MAITLQEIFNTAWQRFVVEKQQPGVSDYSGENERSAYTCQYITDEGFRCAIGHSLPDDVAKKYSGDNSCSFGKLVKGRGYYELFDDEINNMHQYRLDTFQASLHDSHIDLNTGKWKVGTRLELEYTRVADNFGLSIPGESNV